MTQMRKHAGRRRAIAFFWLLISLLAAFAIYESFLPSSDFTVWAILAIASSLFVALIAYICTARKIYVSGNLRFTFSREHSGVIEMHLKRTCCSQPTAALRTSLMTALVEMKAYAEKVGASKLKIETPLFDAGAALLAAKRAAKRLGASYHVHDRELDRVVSILAHRAIHRCDDPKPSLRESSSARMTAYGFTLQLPV